MFNKLITNLPFNPSLLSQVSFYASRLQKEEAVRRIGFFFVALTLFVQLAAAFFPAERSLAASPNHILNGLSSKKDLLQKWDANEGGVQQIYGKFGVTRDNLVAVTKTRISSNDGYWSIGRLPLSNFGIDAEERVIHVGSTAIYQRPLQAWGTATYDVYKGKNVHGVTFWIIENCGNLTFKTPYEPKEPKPDLTIHKTLLTSKKVNPGDTVKFRLEYRNKIAESLATNFAVTDTLDKNFEFVSLEKMTTKKGATLTISNGGRLGYTKSEFSRELVVKVKKDVKSGTVICNQAFIDSKETGREASEKPCVTVVKKCSVPGKENLDANDPKCFEPCPTNSSIPKNDPRCGKCPAGQEYVNGKCVAPCKPGEVRQDDGTCKEPEPLGFCVATAAFAPASTRTIIITTEAHVQNGAKVEGYQFDIENDGKIDATEKSSQTKFEKTFPNLATGSHIIAVKVQMTSANGGVKKTSEACEVDFTIAEDPRVSQTKSVKNITKNGSDANGTKVANGDVLAFQLKTQNTTAVDYKNFEGEDYFGDVLDYADIIDANELTKQGVTLDSKNFLHWKTPVIKANQADIKTITVKVKATIPATNRPSTVSEDQDCRISNRYGNEVVMNVGCPLIKNIEQATGKLPNTGPGTGTIIASGVAIIGGYFYARSRLLRKELGIIKAEYAAGGAF